MNKCMEECMRKLAFLGVLCSSVLVASAADKVQPLNIKTGLWEVTVTSTSSGRPPIPPDVLARMTPQQKANFEKAMEKSASAGPKTRTYKNCITKEQLTKDPFGNQEKNCTRTVLKSTGSKMDLREACVNRGIKTEATIQIDAINSETIKGSHHVTAGSGDRSMNVTGNITGKWLSASCSDKK